MRLMSNDESSDYSRWMELANDPSQSEEARRDYRAKMEAHLQKKLREAFRLARAEKEKSA